MLLLLTGEFATHFIHNREQTRFHIFNGNWMLHVGKCHAKYTINALYTLSNSRKVKEKSIYHYQKKFREKKNNLYEQ